MKREGRARTSTRNRKVRSGGVCVRERGVCVDDIEEGRKHKGSYFVARERGCGCERGEEEEKTI
jgi:hypothetical protein